MSTLVGVISDTHGVLDERAIKVFSDHKVEKIFHAGDIGPSMFLDFLEDVAPVIAVRGNCDTGRFEKPIEPEVTKIIEGNKIYMIHNLEKAKPGSDVDVIISGHTHVASIERDSVSGVLMVNPGAIREQRPPGKLQPSVALLTLDGPHNASAEIVYL